VDCSDESDEAQCGQCLCGLGAQRTWLTSWEAEREVCEAAWGGGAEGGYSSEKAGVGA
jgi:hypothetical protein